MKEYEKKSTENGTMNVLPFVALVPIFRSNRECATRNEI